MGTKAGIDKTHAKLRSELGNENYTAILKERASKGGKVRSEAKKQAATLREARKREARASQDRPSR